MADLDRYDLDPTFRCDCPMCGLQIHWEDETAEAAGEMVHKSCYDEAADELAALDMDWSQSE